MNKIQKLAFALSVSIAFALTLSACSGSKPIQTKAIEEKKIQGAMVIHYPMIAKIEVSPNKMKFIYKVNRECRKNRNCETIAYYSALESRQIDGIIEPIYGSEYDDSDNLNITITGYTYKYKEIREITKEDRDLLSGLGSSWIPVQTNRP